MPKKEDEATQPNLTDEIEPRPPTEEELDEAEAKKNGGLTVMPADDAETAIALTRAQKREMLIAENINEEHVRVLQKANDNFFGALADPSLSQTERMLLSSIGMKRLAKAMTDEIVSAVIMPLMNTPLGFDTDRNPAKWSGYGKKPVPYEIDVVRHCAIQAMMVGLPMVNNCWNIIAGSMYPRKEGFEFLLGQLCRFAPVVTVPPIPKDVQDNGGYLKCSIKIRYITHEASEGLTEEEEAAASKTFSGSYSVRLNKNNRVNVEFAEGKTKRKAYRDLYNSLTGNLLLDGDEDALEAGVIHEQSDGFTSAAEVTENAGKTD